MRIWWHRIRGHSVAIWTEWITVDQTLLDTIVLVECSCGKKWREE